MPVRAVGAHQVHGAHAREAGWLPVAADEDDVAPVRGPVRHLGEAALGVAGKAAKMRAVRMNRPDAALVLAVGDACEGDPPAIR